MQSTVNQLKANHQAAIRPLEANKPTVATPPISWRLGEASTRVMARMEEIANQAAWK
jgi:hypothetical protein